LRKAFTSAFAFNDVIGDEDDCDDVSETGFFNLDTVRDSSLRTAVLAFGDVVIARGRRYVDPDSLVLMTDWRSIAGMALN